MTRTTSELSPTATIYWLIARHQPPTLPWNVSTFCEPIDLKTQLPSHCSSQRTPTWWMFLWSSAGAPASSATVATKIWANKCLLRCSESTQICQMPWELSKEWKLPQSKRKKQAPFLNLVNSSRQFQPLTNASQLTLWISRSTQPSAWTKPYAGSNWAKTKKLWKHWTCV